jgi:hypothetical protein
VSQSTFCHHTLQKWTSDSGVHRTVEQAQIGVALRYLVDYDCTRYTLHRALGVAVWPGQALSNILERKRYASL